MSSSSASRSACTARRAVFTALLAFAVGSLLPAALGAESGSAAPSTPSAPSTAAYTDNSASQVVTQYSFNNSDYYFSRSLHSSAYRYPNFSTRSYITERQRIFFPGSEPALGQPVTRRTATTPAYNIPAKLETYVSEPFFAPLSTHLYAESLSKRRQARIDTYRTERAEALAELRATLDRVKDDDQATRMAALRDLASRQDFRLRELEQQADEIRDELTRGDFITFSVDWNAYRTWRLGDDTRYESATDEFKVVRSAAFFQNGLSLGQRRLLREITIELREAVLAGNNPTADIALDAPGPYFFFSPATSRIRLPLGLPAELTARLDEFRSKKEALKAELRETLYKYDRAWLNSTRTNALSQLAKTQAGAIEELERVAEELRLELAKYPYPDRPAQSILSNDLAKRISSYLTDKENLQRDLLNRLLEVRTALPSDRVEYERKDGSLVLVMVPNRSASGAIKRKREEILKTLPAFNAEKSAAYRDLTRLHTALREEVSKITLAASRRSAQSVDELLAEFSRSFEKQETWNLYREYYTAVLEPGLSPEQRRLLYDAAIEELMMYAPLSQL